MKAESRKQKAEMGRRYLSRNVASRPFRVPVTAPASALAKPISAFCFLLSAL
jgi:hypothetical protein